MQARVELYKRGGEQQLSQLQDGAVDLSASLIGAPLGDHEYITDHLHDAQLQLVRTNLSHMIHRPAWCINFGNAICSLSVLMPFKCESNIPASI